MWRNIDARALYARITRAVKDGADAGEDGERDEIAETGGEWRRQIVRIELDPMCKDHDGNYRAAFFHIFKYN